MKSKIFLSFLLTLCFIFATAFAHAAKNIGATFEGERLEYNISFLFWENAASSYLEFKKIQEKPLRYQAVLYAETQGAAGFFTFYQRNTYRSVMEVVEGGKKLRALSFEKQMQKQGWSEKSLYEFDYHKKTYKKTLYQNDQAVEYKEAPIPAGKIYEDALSAFYNLRYGAYGKPEKGKTHLMPTYPDNGVDFFKIKIAAPEEETQKRRHHNVTEGKWLALVDVPPDLFGSGTGMVDVWISKDLIPLTITVEDVLIFGQVQGTLINRSFKSSFAKDKKR